VLYSWNQRLQFHPHIHCVIAAGGLAPDHSRWIAARVANALAPGGFWLSIIGSTEGSPREVGPPRRSAREVAAAIEPSLEIVELRSADFRGTGAKAWFCLSRKRTVPAQPSTLHD